MQTTSKNQNQVLEHPKVKSWLDECRTNTTRQVYMSRVKCFFRFYKGTVDEFLSLPQEEKRHLMLMYQNREARANTSNGTLGAMNSFLDTLEMKVNFKGKRRRVELDLTSHHFSTETRPRMFELGNTKEKALISLACSLGWEVSSILGFPRKQLQGYVDRAKAECKQFCYFMSQRKKTGVPRLGVLNPLALEWVGKWLLECKDASLRKRKADKVTVDRVVSEVFDLTEEGANKILRRLACEAHLSTTGRVHFHKLRGWVMSGLSRAGWNDWQIKFLVGKKIPATDSTYLDGLQQQIEERYPKAYEEYLNLQRPIKAVTELTKILEESKVKIEGLNAKVSKLEATIKEMVALNYTTSSEAKAEDPLIAKALSLSPADVKTLKRLLAQENQRIEEQTKEKLREADQ